MRSHLQKRLRVSAPVVGLSLAVALATSVGTVAWVTASNGSKQADLGAGLVSSGVFGVLLLLFERALSSETAEVGRKVSLAASPTPAVDTATPAQTPTERGTLNGEKVHEFRVVVDGWMRDRSRIDADQLRLRVYRDGEYFQFFTAIVPGTGMRVGLHGETDITLSQLRRALATAALREVRQKIDSGEAPLGDPTMAIELFPDVDAAVRAARQMPAGDHEEGDEIDRWLA